MLKRRTLLHGGLATATALLAPQARACEFFTTTLRVWHPWTRAAAADAAAVTICLRFDEVHQADRLIGVASPVATGARLLGAGPGEAVNLPIPAGQETALGEDGVLLQLVGLRHELALGRSYPLTLTFERGGSLQATLNTDYTPLRFS